MLSTVARWFLLKLNVVQGLLKDYFDDQAWLCKTSNVVTKSMRGAEMKIASFQRFLVSFASIDLKKLRCLFQLLSSGSKLALVRFRASKSIVRGVLTNITSK